ncbi:MAG: TonB-dependent receptor [Bacteroidetes bacterium]|nr:TonB-dependent receptor [Bacteroidota bacterium]MDA1224338.1 TonB-dependent receptor [Bacteroidota bacterium]
MQSMFALCAISLLSMVSEITPKTDSVSRKLELIKPVDTVFVHVQRIDFATLGRVVRDYQAGNDDRSLTSALGGAGVFFKQYGVAGSSTISRRGADANQTQVNWNGLPVNNAMLGMTDFNTLLNWGNTEMFLVEGGNSASVGSGSMGGTLFLRNGVAFGSSKAVEQKSKLLSTIGSFGERNVAADVSLHNRNLMFQVSALRFESNNAFHFSDLGLDIPSRLMENAHREQSMVRSVLAYNKGSHYLKVVSEFATMQRQLGLALGSFQALGRQEDNNMRSVLEYIYQPNRGFSATHRLGYVKDQINYFSSPSDSKGSLSIGKTVHFQSEFYRIWGIWNAFLGNDIQFQQAHSEYYLGWSSRILPASLVGLSAAKGKMSYGFNGRYEWHEKVPTMGLSFVYQASKQGSIKANVHSSFRRPTLNDLFWVTGGMAQGLMPEKGKGAEVGYLFKWLPNGLWKQNPLGNRHENRWVGQSEVTFYYRTVDQPILWVPKGTYWFATNLSGGGIYVGWQLSALLKYQMGDKGSVVLKSNLDRVSSRVKQTPESLAYQQIFVPNWNGNVYLGVENLRFESGFGVDYTGRRFIQTDNLQSLDPYALLNLQFGLKKLTLPWGLALQCNWEILNVLNQDYVSMPGRPMPGRAFRVTLLIKSNQSK